MKKIIHLAQQIIVCCTKLFNVMSTLPSIITKLLFANVYTKFSTSYNGFSKLRHRVTLNPSISKRAILLVSLACCCCGESMGVNYTVNSTADPGTGSGTTGSLRYCITTANATVGSHNISFSGLAAGSTIALSSTALPAITCTMVIDATTTTGWTANTVGITLDATNNTGNEILNIANVPNVEIYGLQIIGGLSTSFGILINGDNADGFKIGAINKRNFINRAANTIIKVISADNGFIQNNYLGCDVSGSFGYYGQPLTFPPNSGSGLWLTDGADGNTIGGAQAGQGNLIAGGTGLGIMVGNNFDSTPGGTSGCSGNIFYGNRVGGLNTLQFYYIAFWIDGDSDNNIVGGVQAGQANDLSYSSNGFSGDGYGSQVIRIMRAEAQGNTLRGNIMTCGLGAGIGLLTPGANNNQSAPVISNFNSTSNILSGTSNTPGATIDVYLGSDCNGNLTNEIKSKGYLTSTLADANGNWSVDISLFGCLANEQYVTATATHPINGSTGPFSDGFLVAGIAAGTGLPTASFTYVQTNDYVVEFNNTSTPGCTYLWDFGAGITSTEANPSHDFLSENTWPVRLIVTSDCGTDTLDTIVVVVMSGIYEIGTSNLTISEQAGTLSIQSNIPLEKGTLLSLNNISGQSIGSKVMASGNQNFIQIPTQQLAPGIYFITIQSQSEQITLKWLKTNN
jgi:hypothetical protein